MHLRRLAFVLVAAASLSGCALFRRGGAAEAPKAPKNSKTIAADTARTYRERWIEQRRAILVSQGTAPAAAGAQAEADFARTYPGVTSSLSSAK